MYVYYILYMRKYALLLFFILQFSKKLGWSWRRCQLRAHFNFLRGISVLLAFDTVFNSDLLQLC